MNVNKRQQIENMVKYEDNGDREVNLFIHELHELQEEYDEDWILKDELFQRMKAQHDYDAEETRELFNRALQDHLIILRDGEIYG